MKNTNGLFIVLLAATLFACDGNAPEPIAGTDNGHDYVDMGTSVMWATCNIGATQPEEYGEYYAWGEITPKETYQWDTYKYGTWEDFGTGSMNVTLYKYNTSEKYGEADGLTELEPSDDVATVMYGNNWRTPTKEEWEELFDKCVWKYTKRNKVTGYLVTAPNGSSLFLPWSDWKGHTEVTAIGGCGNYWSSTLDVNRPWVAYMAYFQTLCGDPRKEFLTWYRDEGGSVRAVYIK